MKKRPTPYALIGAVAFGLLAIVVFYFYQQKVTQDQQDQANQIRAELQAESDQKIQELKNSMHTLNVSPTDSGATRRVLFATQDIDAGVQITPDMFTAQATPDTILKEAFTTDDSNTIEKSYSLRPIHKGDPLTEGNVGVEAPHLSDRIPIGLKAMAVPALSGEGNLTGGFLVDGDFVDLMFIHPTNPSDPKSSLACDAVVQNLPIIYVPGPEQHSSQMEGIAPATTQGQTAAITVEVTLQEAQILSLLQSIPQTHFQMILRSRKDKQTQKTKTVDQTDLSDNLHGVQTQIEKSISNAKAMANQLKEMQDKGTHETSPPPAPTAP